MAYGDFKDLTRRTALDKIVHDKVVLLKILDTMDIKEVWLQWFIIFLITKRLVVVLKLKIYQTKN